MRLKSTSRAGFVLTFMTALSYPAFADIKASGPWKLGDIIVEQAWARLTPGNAKTGAVYLTLLNMSGDDDLLMAVDSDAARTTALHESKVEGDIAKMVPVPGGLNLPSHGEVVMQPGGIHIMMTELSGVLEPGSMLPVKMIFRDAGMLDFEVPVLPLGAGDPTVEHNGHSS